MKKLIRVFALLLALTVAVPCAASANGLTENAGLKAYWALVGGKAGEDTPAARLLKQVLDGAYEQTADPKALADALPLLAEITAQDLAAFAGQNKMPVEMVRHAYYMSLANALTAEIDRNPAAEEQTRNIQIVLQLFLSARDNDDATPERERDAVRTIISREEINQFAGQYKLPVSFVEFLIMDDDWDDDDWDDDDDWADELDWDLDDWADDDDVRELFGDDGVVSRDQLKEIFTQNHIDFDDDDDDDDDRDDDNDDDDDRDDNDDDDVDRDDDNDDDDRNDDNDDDRDDDNDDRDDDNDDHDDDNDDDSYDDDDDDSDDDSDDDDNDSDDDDDDD